MTGVRALCLLVTVHLLAACNKGEPEAPVAPSAETPVEVPVTQTAEVSQTSQTAQSSQAGRDSPRFGGVTEVVVEAEGIGETPEIAVLKAIDSAIAQVNGRRVGSAILSLESRLRSEGQFHGGESIRADAFMQTVVSASQGAVTGFRILSQQEIQRVEAERIIKAQMQDAGYKLDQSTSQTFDGKASSSADFAGSSASDAAAGRSSASASASIDASASEEVSVSASSDASLSIDRGANSSSYDETERRFAAPYWMVRIEANVAKYVAPEEKGRPKLAIILPRTKSDSYAVGDSRVPASDVSEEIRSRLSDALTQTKRFIILDREFGDVLGEEASFIESGAARNQELARIGQQLAADLLLIVSIDRFEYPRASRNLRMSDRQLISYAGGGRVSLRLINATTGEVVMSESFAHELPATSPSTIPRVIDGKALAGQMMDVISGQMTFAVVNEIFPISVVAMTGATVALSQGGQSVAIGNRYQAVFMGEELIDPQTGETLGKMESPCCVIRIDRVAERTSYGTVEGELPMLPGTFVPGMIELREQIRAIAVEAETNVASGRQVAAAPSTAKPAPAVKPQPAVLPEKAEPAKEDADW